MDYPSISMVTACYNHKNYIAETIESILSQNYPNLQYVVIDDGSTDGSWDIIKKYQDHLHHCERLEGYRESVTTALNYGISKTNAQIMGWLNSDDILLPKSLFTIADVFNDNPSIEWITGMATTINYKSEIINSNLRLKSLYDFLIGDWKVIQQESTFWKRSLWEKAGSHLLTDGKCWAFDTELWTRFFKLTEHCHLSAPLGAFRKGKQSKSISEPETFLNPNQGFLNAMAAGSSKDERRLSITYKILKKIFWPALYLIPNKTIGNIPILKNYTYKVVEYSFMEDKWIQKNKNPFRK